MTAVRSVVRDARHSSQLAWRYGFNFGPSVSYRLSRPGLPAASQQVLRELNERGTSITSVDALPGAAPLFEELRGEAEALVDGLSANASRPAGEKDFVDYLLGDTPVLDTSSTFVRFALLPSVRALADAYLGMFTQLRYYNVWRSRASQDPPSASQLWHQDREDFLILKMFVYLRDVDAGGGPFRYVPGTHPKGAVKEQPAFSLEGSVRRTTDEQMAAVVDPDSWVTATGPAGTIVFADTRGYHCGGLARASDRLLFTALYTSRDSGVREWFVRTNVSPVGRAEAFALGAGRKGPAWGPMW